MEFVFYVVLFLIGVSIIVTFVQNLVHPPLKIAATELPESVQQELSLHFPNFQPREIFFLSSRHRYTMNGTIDRRPARMEFDVNPDHELAEVDFEETAVPTAFQGKTKIAPAAIPSQLAEVMAPFLDAEVDEHATCRAYAGRIGSENAFKIKIRSEHWKYDFEITQSGRLVEYEKETLRI